VSIFFRRHPRGLPMALRCRGALRVLQAPSLRRQSRCAWTAGLSGKELKIVREQFGTRNMVLYVMQKLGMFAVVGAALSWLVWMQYNRQRVPDDRQIYHAWMAVMAAQSPDPLQFVNRPEVRSTTDFQSVASEAMFGGNLRMVLLETPDTMYLALRGPVKDQADPLLRTNRIDATDLTPRDRSHSGLLKYMDNVPIFNIFDDANWFDRHLVICGAGLGGMLAHNLVLQEVYKGHISPMNHRVRSVAFGAAFCNHRKTREDVDARWWKNVLLTVVNRKDPLPAMISATLDPTLLDGQDEQTKAKFARYKGSLSALLADEETGIETPKGAARREKLERQLLADFIAIRHLLKGTEPAFSHFDPIGNWLFLDPAGGCPHVDDTYKSYPDTHEMVWTRKDLRKTFADSGFLDNPILTDARKSAYTDTLSKVCFNADIKPAANRRLPVMDVAFPVYIPPKWR